ncbi:hypothetical protein [Clostridium cellulovorans]|uniref:hypothetical protein n=1 Tax=Clostridium cellulovorans TaxID=1493 RepID=UPI0001A96736|nr:hypothetical protein [Clostridium cellulovorans]
MKQFTYSSKCLLSGINAEISGISTLVAYPVFSNFITPKSRLKDKTEEIMNKRNVVYATAKILNPQRLNKVIRKRDLPKLVALNPNNDIKPKLEVTG